MGTLRAGWARADITPPLGARLRGYFHDRFADAVHDPLNAKALYLTDGDEQAAIVACDVCSLDGPTVALARKLAAERHGLPGERLFATATHTHLGPFCEEHGERLAEGIAGAAAAARDHAAPVTARAGYGFEPTTAFCRRFVMRDGTLRTNPGRHHPELVCAASPIDPMVGLLDLVNGGRRLIVVNFALHLDTIGGTAISADWPYFIEEALRERLGEGVETLFLQGCSGDINHIDVRGDGELKGFEMSESIGRRLAEAIVEALPELPPAELSPLKVHRELLPVDLPRAPEDELAAARALWAGDDRALTRELVRAGVTVQQADRGPVLPVEVVALRLGEVACALFPGELFCDYGRRLKDWSPAEVTLPVELSHDDLAYVPTPEGWVAGGYESWNTLTPPGTGDRLVQAATGALHDLFAEA